MADYEHLNKAYANVWHGPQTSSGAERQKIEEALAESYRKFPVKCRRSEIICAAARRHLETLPKPMWRVTGTLPSGHPAARYETANPETALDFARGYLGQGITHVSVRQVQS